jgi:uncharacterized alpha-E superfamily protein
MKLFFKLRDRIIGAWAVLTGRAFATSYKDDGSHMGSLGFYLERNGWPDRDHT